MRLESQLALASELGPIVFNSKTVFKQRIAVDCVQVIIKVAVQP